jgi:two-component sensor histidine kinase
MVGPDSSDRKILRETDGERFVLLTKGRNFQGEFANCEKEHLLKEMNLTIKNSLYVISYPLARELFAFRKNRCVSF